MLKFGPHILTHFCLKNTVMGQNIKFLRKHSGLSQRELAERLGLKRNNIASYEAGIVEPRAVTFIAIARFFNVDPVLLLSQSVEARGISPAPPSELPTGPGVDQSAPATSDNTQEVRAIIEGLREFYRSKNAFCGKNGNRSDQEIETMLSALTDILGQKNK